MPADRLPNFFLVGAAKAGTSSLHAYLGQHPQVFMSKPKEPTFFALYGEPLPPFHRADGSVVPVDVAHEAPCAPAGRPAAKNGAVKPLKG